MHTETATTSTPRARLRPNLLYENELLTTEELGVEGTVYLICLSKPLAGRSRHYIGWSSQLERRVWHHRNGTGAKFLAAANEAGIRYKVVATWEGQTRLFERHLKRQHEAAKYCPRCEKKFRTRKRRNRRDAVKASGAHPTKGAPLEQTTEPIRGGLRLGRDRHES